MKTHRKIHVVCLQLLLVLGLLVGNQATAKADQLKYGIAEYEAGRYEKAFKIFKQLADEGNSLAKFELAKIHLSSYGIYRNIDKAYKIFKQLAEEGNSLAKIELAKMYVKGYGIDKSKKKKDRYNELIELYEKAFKIFKQLADEGNSLAKIELAKMYVKGYRIIKDKDEYIALKDYEKSLMILKQLIEEGNSLAKFKLAKMYRFGEGVVKDSNKYFKLAGEAAKEGLVEAQLLLAANYMSGGSSMFPGPPKNYRIAAKYYRMAAEQGNRKGQSWFGFCYYHGKGVEQNFILAHKWYRMAAERGDFLAQEKLGHMYYYGQGVPRDYLLAYKWLNLALPAFHPNDQKEPKNILEILEEKLTPDAILEAQKMAREWKPKTWEELSQQN
jgi:uncharacterized protein